MTGVVTAPSCQLVPARTTSVTQSSVSSEADNAHALGEPRAGEPAFKLFEITGFDKDLPHHRSRRVQKSVPRGSGFFCAMGTRAGVPQIFDYARKRRRTRKGARG